MESHYWYVNDILAADTAYAGEPEGYDETYYDGLWSETGTLTQILFQAASEAVASGWYTAWIDAGSPLTFREHTADFDFDGDVDSSDLALWRGALGGTNAGDSDGDGDTDGADFLQWQTQYTGAVAPPSSAARVPEPGSLGLLLAGALLTACEKRCVKRGQNYFANA